MSLVVAAINLASISRRHPAFVGPAPIFHARRRFHFDGGGPAGVDASTDNVGGKSDRHWGNLQGVWLSLRTLAASLAEYTSRVPVRLPTQFVFPLADAG